MAYINRASRSPSSPAHRLPWGSALIDSKSVGSVSSIDNITSREIFISDLSIFNWLALVLTSCLFEMTEDAQAEVEALKAICADDMCVVADDLSALVFFVSPECDEEKEVIGSVVLLVTLPDGYPHSAEASVTLTDLSSFPQCFAHRLKTKSDWTPTAEQAHTMANILCAAVKSRSGECCIWDTIEAAREWLATNTLDSKPEPVGDLAAQLGNAEMSEDDLELDEEDMDEEMIEALREVLRGGGALRKPFRDPELIFWVYVAGSRAD